MLLMPESNWFRFQMNTVQNHSIPDLIRKMRKSRRALKGEYRTKMTKAIDTRLCLYTT